MSKKLNPHDQRVIDLLLDQAEHPAGAIGAASGYSQPSGSVSSRVGIAENLLSLLDLYRVEEPPADLVMRTLSRIDGNFPMPPSSSIDRRDSLGPMA